MTVLLKVGADFAFNFLKFDYSLPDIPEATHTSGSKSTITADFKDGTHLEISGHHLTYDSHGIPNGGDIRKIVITKNDHDVMSITGMELQVADVRKVIVNGDATAAANLIKSTMSGDDKLVGGNHNDVLYAFGGNDTVQGNNGNDQLNGGAGNDWIYGGAGADKLTGGAGHDTFFFRLLRDSTVATSGQDTIYDFTKDDKIDLHEIDASSKSTGNQAFKWMGTSNFDGHAGELRYEKHASDTYIYADTNGDKHADFAIHLDDAVTLKAGYFVL